MTKRLRNMRRVGVSEWSDGQRKYQFAEVDPGAEIVIPNGIPFRILSTDGDNKAVSVDTLSAWVYGQPTQISVTPRLNGTVNISLAPAATLANRDILRYGLMMGA